MGYKKLVDEKDQQITMESMLGQRKLTTGEIQKHFDCFGLEPAFAQHTRMGALSGGQKVKVVLGAGLWNLPHLIILDVMMPVMDGIETCEILRNNPKFTETIITFFTANSTILPLLVLKQSRSFVSTMLSPSLVSKIFPCIF